MAYVDISIIPKEIDRYGEVITLEKYSGPTVTDYGDVATQTTTEATIRGIFNDYGAGMSNYTDSRYNETRFSFFFKPDQASITNGNVIVRSDDTKWRIERVVKHAISGNTVVQEASVKNN